MKRKLIDKESGKVLREWNARDYSILIGLINNPPKIFKNKKKYTRKEKHKKTYEE